MLEAKDKSSSELTGQMLGPALAREWLIGESRVNFIRMGAIALFYFQHWILFYRIADPSPAEMKHHALASIVAVVWGLSAAFLQIALSRAFRPSLSYLATGIDLLLITTLIVASSAGGPFSRLIVIYFLVIGASVLRFSLPLVYFTTILTVLLYLSVLGHYTFVAIGYQRYYSEGFSTDRVPRSLEVIFALALLMSGVIAAQAVRQSKRLARVASDLRAGTLDAAHEVSHADEQLALVIEDESSE